MQTGIHMNSSVGLSLLWLAVSNTAPWAAGLLLGKTWSAPMDMGLVLPDGERLLGSHKTWRGLVVGSVACSLAACLTGFSLISGAGFGAASLLGDALSSCAKRRMRLRPGQNVPGLDQLPEALLPLCLFGSSLHLGLVDIAVVAVTFTTLNLLFERSRRPR
jgi:CDP-2,3-bis-(O-geranylgeranyl)-sn-glycerol synthase